MERKITKRQSDALRAIIDYEKEKGQMPTMRDVGNKLGISSLQSIADLLNGLVRNGFLKKDKNRPRGIVLTKEARDIMKVEQWHIIKQLSLTEWEENLSRDHWGTQTKISQMESEPGVLSYSSKGILDTDAASFIRSGKDLLLTTSQLSFEQFMIESAATELLNKFDAIPQNIKTISDPLIFLNSCTFFNTFNDTILMTWHSSDGANFYHGKFEGSDSNFALTNYNPNSHQLELPFTNPFLISNRKLAKAFKREINKISKFGDFPIFGAALTHRGNVYICSSHTARKKTDFGIFLTAIQKGWVVISGGDKRLIRDLIFNNLRVISLRNLLVNNSTEERRLQ